MGATSVSVGSETTVATAESTALAVRIAGDVREHGGWLPFDRYMESALYAPGLGYYARDDATIFGAMPSQRGTGGSDYVTAPELSPWFGRLLARQLAQALDAADADRIVEVGAGSGALAETLLDALGDRVARYAIVDVSAPLRRRQQVRLARYGDRVRWLDALPDALHGVVVANEVLDAMPVRLLHWTGTRWLERGVALDGSRFVWSDRASGAAPPPVDPSTLPAGYVTETHGRAMAFVRQLADRLVCGAAFFVDYGFPQAEYYHPQRATGTLVCHRGHRVDTDPLVDVGRKDLTAHVEFSAVALAAQDAGLDVVGYTSQARFLLNCGFAPALVGAGARDVAAAQKLVAEHEMGELFKVIAFAKSVDFEPIGFAVGDRTHRL